MLSRWVRRWDARLLGPLVGLLARLGITPNMLTVGSLIGMVAAGAAVALGDFPLALALLAVGGAADAIDGELARHTGAATPFGGFLDSICDHCGDYAFSLGLIWFYLGVGARVEVALVVAGLFGSMLGSQVRSRAGMLGFDAKDVGLATRLERLALWVIGIATGQLTLALAALALITNLAALQRIVYVFRRAAKS